MNYSKKVSLSFISIIVGAICWIIGDIALLGFKVNPNDFPLLAQTYAQKIDVALAVQMQTASTERLMFGALIGALTAPLFLPGIWLACQYFKNRARWYVWLVYLILVCSVVLSPLGHAVFFYVGEIFKSIAHTPAEAHAYLLERAAGFTKSLYISWGAAISLMMLGWGIFSVLIFMKKTWLPRWMGLLTPALLTLVLSPANKWLHNSQLKAWIVAASFNLFYFIFFVTLFILFRNKIKRSDNFTTCTKAV